MRSYAQIITDYAQFMRSYAQLCAVHAQLCAIMGSLCAVMLFMCSYAQFMRNHPPLPIPHFPSLTPYFQYPSTSHLCPLTLLPHGPTLKIASEVDSLGDALEQAGDKGDDEEISHRDILLQERIENMIENKKREGQDICLTKDVAMAQGFSGSLGAGIMRVAEAQARSQKVAAMIAQHAAREIKKAAALSAEDLDADQLLLLERVRSIQERQLERLKELKSKHSVGYLEHERLELLKIETFPFSSKSAKTAKRREVREALMYSDEGGGYRCNRKALGQMMLAELTQATEGDLSLLDGLPVSSMTMQALAEARAEHARDAVELRLQSVFAHEAYSVARLLGAAGVIEIPVAAHFGRKPVNYVRELETYKKMGGQQAVQYFLDLLGFANLTDTCHCNWSLAHYLADSMSFSEFAANALHALATDTMYIQAITAIINDRTIGSRPNGWTVLHFVCDGSDTSYQKATIAHRLIERQADIEAETDSGCTPVLRAASTGVVDVLQVLIQAGADVNKVMHPKTTADYGRPILQLAHDNSEEMYREVWALPELVWHVSFCACTIHEHAAT